MKDKDELLLRAGKLGTDDEMKEKEPVLTTSG
jgi:hypothetical protein